MLEEWGGCVEVVVVVLAVREGAGCQRGSQPGSQDTLCRPLEMNRKRREGAREEEREKTRETFPKQNTKT